MKNVTGCAMAGIFACLQIAGCGSDSDDNTAGNDSPENNTPVIPAGNTDTPGTDTPGTDTPSTDTPGTDTPGSDTPGNGTATDVPSDAVTTQFGTLRVTIPAGAEIENLSTRWLATTRTFQIATRPASTGDINVRLLDYSEDDDFITARDFYAAQESYDTCDVREPDGGGNGGNTGGGGESSAPPYVNGGVVQLISAGGGWVNVPYDSNAGVYDGDNIAPGPMPDDLALNIEGRDFPIVEAYPLRVPEVPQRLSPGINEAVSTATEYRWVPTDDGADLEITFQQYIDGNFERFPIVCYVRDDGEFTMPPEVISAVETLPGVLNVRYEAQSRALEYRDGIAFYQRITISDD